MELGLQGGLFALVLAHLAQNGIFLVGLQINARLAGCSGLAEQRVRGRIGGRTSMSSFHGMSASGCERAPLTVTACLLAGGAESSCPLGLLRSSILTLSSDGGATVLASSLITDTGDSAGGGRWRGSNSEMRAGRRMSGMEADGKRRQATAGGGSCEPG